MEKLTKFNYANMSDLLKLPNFDAANIKCFTVQEFELTGKADISSSPPITCILTAMFLADPCLLAKLIHFG